MGQQHQIANQHAGADGVCRAVALSDPALGFVAVADADGNGPTAGAAGQLAADIVRAHVARNTDVLDRFRRNPTDDLRERIIGVLKEGILRADSETTALASRKSGDLAVSFDAALLVGSETFVAHVGAGRVYLARRGLLHRLTVDHVAGGQNVPDDAPPRQDEPSASPVDAAPSRALGRGQKPEIEMLCIDAQPGDRIVAANRELVQPMSDVELRDVIAQHPVKDLVPHLLEIGRRSSTRGVACGCVQVAGASKKEREARLAILGRMAMLAHCTADELVAVASATRPRTYRAGEEIVSEGHAGREMFLVVSGQLGIVKDGATIATLEPGSTFGEMAMLDDPRASATVRAATDVELLVIAREAFFGLLKTDATFAVKILWNMLLRLSANLRVTSARLAEMTRGGSPS